MTLQLFCQIPEISIIELFELLIVFNDFTAPKDEAVVAVLWKSIFIWIQSIGYQKFVRLVNTCGKAGLKYKKMKRKT